MISRLTNRIKSVIKTIFTLIFINHPFLSSTILFFLWVIGGIIAFYPEIFFNNFYNIILLVLFVLVAIAFFIEYSRKKPFTNDLYTRPAINTNNSVNTWKDVVNFWKLVVYSLVIFTLIWLHSVIISFTSSVIDIFKINLNYYPVSHPPYHIPLAIYCFLLFIAIFAFLTSFKTSLMVKEEKYHIYYGLIQIITIVVLVTAVLSSVSYVIYIFSSRFLNGKDTLDLIKWSIGALGLGLNAFNIKLFVDYFRGAKVNAPYSLEQLQQLQILQQMQENIEDTDKPEKKLSQEKIMNQKDIKSQIKNVKDSGNL